MSVYPGCRLVGAARRVSISCDDLLFFNTFITKEIRLLDEHPVFTDDELKQITLHAVQGAFLPEEEKTTLLKGIERDWPAAGERQSALFLLTI